jgi:hypothetical protein
MADKLIFVNPSGVLRQRSRSCLTGEKVVALHPPFSLARSIGSALVLGMKYDWGYCDMVPIG